MQNIFKALVPESVRNEARCLVEYCCFRFLSRDNSDVHPSLKVYKRTLFKFMLSLVFKINGHHICLLLVKVHLTEKGNKSTIILDLHSSPPIGKSACFLSTVLDPTPRF